MPRLRPTRLDFVLDAQRLSSQLALSVRDAYGDPIAQRARALEGLRAALFRGRMIAKERLENGASGVETARLLCGVTDVVIRALWDFTVTIALPEAGPSIPLALAATGGYGRGVLAPFSDIDLLFLRGDAEDARIDQVIGYVLYALWDLGFKVGHASRTVEECLSAAADDMTIRTSLLELRGLAGDSRLTDTLKVRFRAQILPGTAPAFIAAKLAERDARHARSGASRFVVEPNVKDGKGGLRDLHTLFWIARYLHPEVEDEAALRGLMFEGRELRAVLRAFEFLEAVRAHLHFATGRPEERLTFDLQPEVARRMGYVDAPEGAVGGRPAVERFMRRYFLIAKDVGVLTRAFATKLEADDLKGVSRDGASCPVVVGDAESFDRGFIVDRGRLSIRGPEVFEVDPVNLIRLFKVADQYAVDLHPDAFTAAARSLHLISARVRRDPAAARVFLDILVRSRDPRRALELMNEAGVLGRFLPEFGHVVGKMQFNMYHAYTVDEHTLRAIGVIADIAAGRLQEDHPLSTSIFPLVEDREALFLAMLLHDTGKGGVGGQTLAGARAARQACERLGLKPEAIDLVAWLVEHHLDMSDVAQKRDIADPATVSSFAGLVETPERLRALLILTVADIRAVGPGVWNGWKGQLLRELYQATETVFRGGRSSDAAAAGRRRLEAVAFEARTALVAADPGARAWAGSMEDAYFAAFSRAEQVAHLELSRRARQRGGAAARAQVRPQRVATEVVLVAQDRQGLFADLALAISRIGGNLVGARIFTSNTGEALDVFYVQDSAGRPFGGDHPQGLDRLCRALEVAALGEAASASALPSADTGRASAFAIASSVVVDQDASIGATVVEAIGRDRPGLVHALARRLSDLGLSIQSAHVDNYGERAVDAFYVSTSEGRKLTDPELIARVRDGLTEILEAGELASRPRRLTRARASAAR
ncbi:MAG: [protein-PII] uridylyltransferase [Alphaproteobacteria bacterium]|nr:[protein-PII] uridylyltransferase [Alphaproteobacteria bacterium]